MAKVVARRKIQVITGAQVRSATDQLAGEEPLEIRVNGQQLAVTMRTPGADFELALGFLLSEGIITEHADVRSIRYCPGREANEVNTFNVLDVDLASASVAALAAATRHTFTSSSCGVCGKGSLDSVRTTSAHPPGQDSTRLQAQDVIAMPELLREHQRVFEATGGLHAAGLFRGREVLAVREDVGRHNAVDKVVGWALSQELVPLTGTVLCVSGRASFELVQKAAMAGVPALVAVSAPSSLAVDLAQEMGITLMGFARGESMNVYSGGHRLDTGG